MSVVLTVCNGAAQDFFISNYPKCFLYKFKLFAERSDKTMHYKIQFYVIVLKKLKDILRCVGWK
jgi:hypothetical protein